MYIKVYPLYYNIMYNNIRANVFFFFNNSVDGSISMYFMFNINYIYNTYILCTSTYKKFEI